MVTANPAMWNGLRQVLFYLAAVVLARPDSVGQLRVKLMFLSLCIPAPAGELSRKASALCISFSRGEIRGEIRDLLSSQLDVCFAPARESLTIEFGQ